MDEINLDEFFEVTATTVPSGNTAIDWSNLTTSSSSYAFNETKSSGKLSLTGDNADIDINGVSLTQTLKNIQERLDILQPNSNLEAQWEELAELGKLYREKEAELLKMNEMWHKLKS